MITRISTVGMSREAWLSVRKNTIGGSDAAAIIGLDHYRSPYAVWAEKTGRLAETEDNEAMRIGRDLEDYVAKRFSEKTGKKVRRDNSIIYNSDYPFAHANIDRVIIGEDAGLECKTTSTLNLKQFKRGLFPDRYYVQCMHYLAVTGKKRWYLAVLILGKGFEIFEIERDEDEITALMSSERNFYDNYLQPDEAPAIDGTASTTEAVNEIYSEEEGGNASLLGLEEACSMLEEIAKQERKCKELKMHYQNIIKTAMKLCETAENEKYSITWKTQERRTFNEEGFRTVYPGIDLSPFFKTSKSRVFKFKILEEF